MRITRTYYILPLVERAKELGVNPGSERNNSYENFTRLTELIQEVEADPDDWFMRRALAEEWGIPRQTLLAADNRKLVELLDGAIREAGYDGHAHLNERSLSSCIRHAAELSKQRPFEFNGSKKPVVRKTANGLADLAYFLGHFSRLSYEDDVVEQL